MVKIVEMKMIVVNGYLKIDENRNMKMVVYVCVENLLLLLWEKVILEKVYWKGKILNNIGI